MEDCIVYEQIISQKEIETVMMNCAQDFYEQSLNNPDTIKMLSTKFSQYGIFIYAREKEKIVGFVAFYANDKIDYCGFISLIITKHQFQGRGIGGALLQKSIELCRHNGMMRLRLEVNIHNERALFFYKKNGFVEIDKKNTSFFLEKNLLID